MVPKRTLLFVPGNRENRIKKALASNADAVIIDLEDSVPFAEKDNARQIAKGILQTITGGIIYVRVNGLETRYIESDLTEIMCTPLTGIVLPKVEGGEDIFRISDLMSSAEKKADIKEGGLEVIPIIESATGIEKAYEIASARPRYHRVRTAAFGAADYTLDMGISLTKEGTELLYPRSRLAVACRAAGIEPPIDSPWMIDLKDIEGLVNEAKLAKQLGFQGKLLIHPNQIGPVNEIFSPSSDELEYANKVIEAFQDAEERGSAAITLNGKFIDYPVVERARRIVALAEVISKETK